MAVPKAVVIRPVAVLLRGAQEEDERCNTCLVWDRHATEDDASDVEGLGQERRLGRFTSGK